MAVRQPEQTRRAVPDVVLALSDRKGRPQIVDDGSKARPTRH
jgi:hypothetical protein